MYGNGVRGGKAKLLCVSSTPHSLVPISKQYMVVFFSYMPGPKKC